MCNTCTKCRGSCPPSSRHVHCSASFRLARTLQGPGRLEVGLALPLFSHVAKNTSLSRCLKAALFKFPEAQKWSTQNPKSFLRDSVFLKRRQGRADDDGANRLVLRRERREYPPLSLPYHTSETVRLTIQAPKRAPARCSRRSSRCLASVMAQPSRPHKHGYFGKRLGRLSSSRESRSCKRGMMVAAYAAGMQGLALPCPSHRKSSASSYRSSLVPPWRYSERRQQPQRRLLIVIHSQRPGGKGRLLVVVMSRMTPHGTRYEGQNDGHASINMSHTCSHLGTDGRLHTRPPWSRSDPSAARSGSSSAAASTPIRLPA